MKTRLLYFLWPLLASLVGVRSYAQIQQERFVVSSAGKSDTLTTSAKTYFVDWTIGEPLTETLAGSKKKLTQGFHQSLLNAKSTYIFSILDHENSRYFNVFPNPFVSHFSVQWNFSENLNLLFEVYTLEGKRIFSKRQNAMDAQVFIQLNHLKPSIYILRISDPSRAFFETHKLVKF